MQPLYILDDEGRVTELEDEFKWKQWWCSKRGYALALVAVDRVEGFLVKTQFQGSGKWETFVFSEEDESPHDEECVRSASDIRVTHRRATAVGALRKHMDVVAAIACGTHEVCKDG